MSFRFVSTYSALSATLYANAKPYAPENPSITIYNSALASALGIELSEENKIEYLSGKKIPQEAKPIAQAYAGHQFGHFNILGDGRAILLGEHLLPNSSLVDIQLKGSGITPYSRRGDGKATLYSMLREYVMSEAMYHLHIPTSRSLAVINTNEIVWRDKPNMGGMLTRVASSHIRVGTFEYIAATQPKEILLELTNYTIHRHYPELEKTENKAIALLEKVMQTQVDLIVNWMRVGFIHGVMNTDNMSIAGETIDYGPCAMMNAYHKGTVFSSIDTNGRYAFGNQPSIAQWNIVCLANALLPIIHEDHQEAIALATNVINQYAALYEATYRKMMANKLGLINYTINDNALIDDILDILQSQSMDYTNTFAALSFEIERETHLPEYWLAKWKERIASTLQESKKLMQSTNPTFIVRNHLIEEALIAASENNTMELLHNLLDKLKSPYNYATEIELQSIPEDGDKGYATFCGT
jgi:serine/tyrosine/threonine adenylyltransferase